MNSTTPSPQTLKRLHREIADLKKEDLGEIKLYPSDSSLFEWHGVLPGPEGSVYQGGIFKLALTLPMDYPFSSPKVSFSTRIYHMNIAQSGAICLDTLKHNWSPALSLFKVMLSISSLLTDPNPKDPLVPAIATEYTKKRAKHDQTAREWVQLYALPPAPAKPKAAPAPKPRTNKTKAPAVVLPPIDMDVADEPQTLPNSSKAAQKRKRDAESSQGPGSSGGNKRRSAGGGSQGDSEVIVIED